LVAYYSPTVFAFFFFIIRPPPSSTLFPYTTLFRSLHVAAPPTGLLLAPPPGDQCGPGPQRRPGERPERTLPPGRAELHEVAIDADRKSTRLNSSHVKISYAVFCLKKKKKKKTNTQT